MNVARDKITVFTGGKDGGKRKPPSGGGGQYDPDDWRHGLVRTRDGDVKGVPHNLMLILEHDAELADLFWLDEFGNRIALSRQPPWRGGTHDEFTEVDAFELSGWLGNPARYTMSIGTDIVLAGVEAIARRRKRHSVREYLNGLTWDGTRRIGEMFPSYFGAVNNTYARDCGPCFMVSAVSRILFTDPTQPAQASKVDFMVVMEGEQGGGKTTATLELFSPAWYAEATESPAHKDFYQCLRGRWGIEIGEMDAFSKPDVSKVKQAITVRFDVYRASYARSARAYRRECVFVGTTNKDDWQRDETGGRRFLPLKVGRVEIKRLIADRDQLWAEAVHLYREGFKWWVLPEDAKREQDERYSEDVWTGRVQRWLDGADKVKLYDQLPKERIDLVRSDSGSIETERVGECSIAEILSYAIGVDAARQGRAEATRVGAIMTRLGWGHYRPMQGGARVRVYRRPGWCPQ